MEPAKVTPIILPTPDGPVEAVIISLPASAFADLRVWERLGGFEPVELPDPELG